VVAHGVRGDEQLLGHLLRALAAAERNHGGQDCLARPRGRRSEAGAPSLRHHYATL
jgi:hypothetical protein